MIRQCPECQHRLQDFAVECEKCGWSIIKNTQPTAQSNDPSSAPAAAEVPDHVEDPGSIAAVVVNAEVEGMVERVTGTPGKEPITEATESDLSPSALELPELGIDDRIQLVMNLIEQERFKTALSHLNRAIIDAPPEKLAECFSLRGYVHLKNLEFDRAEADCTEAISHDWDEAQTYAWRAAARGEQNRWRLAFDDLDRACELAGPHQDRYLRLMESYSKTASDFFRELIKAGKDSPDMFFERGWIYFKSGKYQKAQRDFQHALKQSPGHPWASIGMAELSLHEGQTSGVKEACDAALHGPEDCQRYALRIRAALNQRQGNAAGAKRDLDQLAELAGDCPREIVECCRLRNQLGDNVTAIDELTEVLKTSPDYHIAILVRGDCYRDIRNYPFAINDYSAFLRHYPDDIQALICRATAFQAAKRWESAHADLDRVLQIDDTEFEAYLVRSKVYLDEGKLDDALSECRTAVRLDNNHAEAFSVLAAIYNRLCDYGSAIEEYSRAYEIAESHDDKAQNLYCRGISYYELGDFDKALKDFKKSCRLRPNHAGSWIWKAACCARLEEWSAAILGLQQAILVRPSASQEYQKLGTPVAEKAIEFFNRQMQRGHESAELFHNRGLAFQFLGRDQEAILDYTSALNRQQDDVDTLIRRGQVLTRAGDYDAAIDDFSNVIKQDKTNHRARYCRAIARLAEGKYEEARTDLLKAIKAAPNHPRYHILLGELAQKMGDLDGVIAAFDRAIIQDPTNPATYRRRGAAHLAAGRCLQAISDFTHSLELYPAQMDVLVSRGQAYLKSGQPIMAIEDFEVALTHNDRLAKAYSGRATALVTQGRHEYTLIWLTKAIHRFEDPRELSEIIFSRGKVFYQMGRTVPAIVDFSSVIELMRGDKRTVAAARYARAIAEIQNEQFEDAERDFRKLVKADSRNTHFREGLKWLSDRSQPRPRFLDGPETFKRPTRPPVIRNGVALTDHTIRKWESAPPYDTWVVRTSDRKEYGPVHFGILSSWANEGRLDIGMRLLRADWRKWQRVEKILPEITPLESTAGMIEEFPELDLGGFAPGSISREDA